AMGYTFVFFLTQLLGQIPMLLTYVAGGILALVFWRRYPRPSRFTLLAMILLLLTTLVQSFLFSYFIQARDDFGWSFERYSMILSATGLIGSLIRVAAFVLLLTAVFTGRKVAQQSISIQALQLSEPASPQPEEHGITTRPSS